MICDENGGTDGNATTQGHIAVMDFMLEIIASVVRYGMRSAVMHMLPVATWELGLVTEHSVIR